MHGNVNEICARLLDSFDPQQRISLLIWTALLQIVGGDKLIIPFC
ncbi:hypothetical protein [Klebsiella pneumoniae]|nr:hypothetical protein [Klebsiella pneumoniae]MDY2188595.1 hypothetical protein [Klebsiella pneumoniae]